MFGGDCTASLSGALEETLSLVKPIYGIHNGLVSRDCIGWAELFDIRMLCMLCNEDYR